MAKREWLKEARLKAGLSQAKLAREVGCECITIEKLEAGTGNPGRDLVFRISKRLGTDPMLFHNDTA